MGWLSVPDFAPNSSFSASQGTREPAEDLLLDQLPLPLADFVAVLESGPNVDGAVAVLPRRAGSRRERAARRRSAPCRSLCRRPPCCPAARSPPASTSQPRVRPFPSPPSRTRFETSPCRLSSRAHDQQPPGDRADPIFVILPSFGSRGSSSAGKPSRQAAKSRPRRKLSIGGAKTRIAIAHSRPISRLISRAVCSSSRARSRSSCPSSAS